MKYLAKAIFSVTALIGAATAQAQYGNVYGNSHQSMPSYGTGSNMNSESVRDLR